MYEVGRVCCKTAGRDSNKFCVIVEMLPNNYALIDGQTRRKKVNLLHLEPTGKTLDISKGASSADVANALKSLNIVVQERGAKRIAKDRLKKTKVVKQKSKKSDASGKDSKDAAEKKTSKKAAKKE